MVKKETKLCIIKTIINSISNIIIAEFRRKKRNTLFPAARFCLCQQAKSGGGRPRRYPPPQTLLWPFAAPTAYLRPRSCNNFHPLLSRGQEA